MKPRVVLLSAFVSPYRSGAEACAEEVSARLQDRYEITIVAARMRKRLPVEDKLPSGVKIIRVGLGRPIDKWLYPFLAPLAARTLKPQIVHAVLESFAGMALVFCSIVVPGAKRILTCQSTNTSLFLGLMHRTAHRITAISSVLSARAQSFGRDDVLLISNGVELRDFKHREVERIPGRILFIGRLEPMKGVDTLFEAYALLHASQFKLQSHICVVGDGSQRDRLERLARTLGIGHKVTFHGNIPHDRVADEYAKASIFCGLSRSEALGNVFLEAQAAGCAVVATNVGGIPDIVDDNVTGVLVPPNDPVAASRALERLLANAELRKRLGEAGRAHAAAFDWHPVAEQYGAVYEGLLV
jgi:glycosyltransferase involved in cell wall biosynthesis